MMGRSSELAGTDEPRMSFDPRAMLRCASKGTYVHPILSQLAGRFSHCLAVVLCLLCAVCFAKLISAGELGSSECWTVNLRKPFGWVRSTAWSVSGEALLVVDLLDRSSPDQIPTQKLLELSPQGEFQPAPRSLYPSAKLRTAGGSYFLKNSGSGEILRLNGHWELESSTGFRASTQDGKAEQTAIYDWSPLGDGGFLAFGALRRSEQGLREPRDKALLYFDDHGIQQIFYELEASADEGSPQYLEWESRWHYFNTETPYLATLGEKGYILFLGEEPAIGEVILGREGVRELQFFPEDFRSRPRFKRKQHWTGPERAVEFYKTLEMSTMAVALYSWGEHLYLLTKQAITRNRETAWWLIKLDPRNGTELERVRLPTKEAHLAIAPGDFWALIEKGPVEVIGKLDAPYRKMDSMVHVPAGWLENPDSGRLDAELRVDCVVLNLRGADSSPPVQLRAPQLRKDPLGARSNVYASYTRTASTAVAPAAWSERSAAAGRLSLRLGAECSASSPQESARKTLLAHMATSPSKQLGDRSTEQARSLGVWMAPDDCADDPEEDC